MPDEEEMNSWTAVPMNNSQDPESNMPANLNISFEDSSETAEQKKGSAANSYAKSRIMTAGKLQAVIMLLEKAESMLAVAIQNGGEIEHQKISQIQNIIAQIEMSLNFEKGPNAERIFEVLELAYECAEKQSPRSLETCKFSLGHLRETLQLATQL